MELQSLSHRVQSMFYSPLVQKIFTDFFSIHIIVSCQPSELDVVFHLNTFLCTFYFQGIHGLYFSCDHFTMVLLVPWLVEHSVCDPKTASVDIGLLRGN